MSSFFFFNDTATTEIYTLSLHDALPILVEWRLGALRQSADIDLHRSHLVELLDAVLREDVHHPRCQQIGKSTRLNSSHANISYAVFCLKKKKHSTAS